MEQLDVVVTNVFGDQNIGGAAITAATVRQCIPAAGGEDRIGLLLVRPGDGRTALPVNSALFPRARILQPPIVRSERLAGLRALCASLFVLATGRGAAPALEAIRRSRLVVSKGGWVFTEREGVGGLVGFWMTVFPLVYARRCGVPTATFPTSIGPFERLSSRVVVGWVLRRLSLVHARDPLSYREALGLGVRPERLRQSPDGVFGYPAPDDTDVARVVSEHGLKGARTLVCCPRPAERHGLTGRTIDVMEATVRRMLDEGAVNRVLVVCHAGGDRNAAQALTERLGSAEFIDGTATTPDELMALYAAAGAIVTARLHCGIFAIVAGTPAITISVDGHKSAGVYDAVGLPADWVVEPDQLTIEALVSRITTALSPDARERTGRASEAARSATAGVAATFCRLAGRNENAPPQARADRRGPRSDVI